MAPVTANGGRFDSVATGIIAVTPKLGYTDVVEG
jgi:hypothetical protein